MKKKILFIILSLFLCLSLSSCLGEKTDNINYEEKDIKFTNTSNEYDIKATSLKTYFIDGGVTPYVEYSEFFKTLDGLFDGNNMSFSRTSFFNEARMNFKLDGSFNVSSVINWNQNVIKLTDLFALNVLKSTSATSYNKFLKSSSTKASGGSSVKLDLGKYGFEIYNCNNKCLLPLSIMNFLYCGTNYYNIYYNGIEYYGAYFLIQDNENYNNVYKNELINKNVSLEQRTETFNLVNFIMNYFYGLYSYYDDINEKLDSLKEEFLSTDPIVYTKAEYKFFISYLNEMHTGIANPGYNVNPASINKDEFYGSSVINYKNIKTKLSNLQEEYEIDSDEPSLRFYENTAIIYFTSFDTAEDSKTVDEDGNVKSDAYLYDTYYMMRKFMSDISKRSEIKNVVFDVSNNGGGNIAALFRLMGFITNKEIAFAQYNPLNNRKVVSGYVVDILGNGNYGVDAYTNYNYFVQTSVLTYSSANIFSGLCKNLGYAKVIGQKSGGGMCGVTPLVLPDGLSLQISGLNQLRVPVETDRGYDLLEIEKGIEVDYEIPYDDFYNDDKLVELINSIK